MRWTSVVAASIVIAAGCQPAGGPGTVTTGSLYEEMIDLTGLATFPDPAYETVQYSSYDRRSRVPGGPDWFANSDGFGGETIPGFEAVLDEPGQDSIGRYLIADVEGPGALVRLWTAAIDGSVRLWLDGAADPVWEGPANDFFQSPLDSFPQTAGLDRERLERTLYERDAVYAPMPFARRFRLEWTGNLHHIHFYQLEVRRYAPGTRVVTFTPEDLATYRETIEGVTQALADPDNGILPDPDAEVRQIAVPLEPGDTATALTLEGGGALERLELAVEAADLDAALRQTVLRIAFDGHPSAQVEAPLGDFFGAAPGVQPYVSLPFTVRPDGAMISRWVMPYERTVTVRLENLGAQPVTVTGLASVAPYVWDPERSMHFSARWRVDHDLVADPRAVQDLPFLVARGEGVYVGTTSLLLNPSPVPTPYGGWWGEGDEKVFVDDRPQPSLFGTGSEDYYNYSWSSPDVFWFPYCGQPRNDGPGNRGFVADYRWHVLDPVPFTRSIAFYMELYSHERTPGLSYARVGYHYARPGVTDDHVAITPADVRTPRLPEWSPAARMGARNSVMYQTEELPGGTQLPLERGSLYAGGRLPVWRPARSGDELQLRVPVADSGEYRVHFVTRLDPRGGTVRVRFDGEPTPLAGGDSTVDAYRPYRTLLRDYSLAPRQLSAGTHTLGFVFDNAPDDVPRPEIGFDFVWVQKVN